MIAVKANPTIAYQYGFSNFIEETSKFCENILRLSFICESPKNIRPIPTKIPKYFFHLLSSSARTMPSPPTPTIANEIRFMFVLKPMIAIIQAVAVVPRFAPMMTAIAL